MGDPRTATAQTSAAEALVLEFLQLMEARDLDGAARRLAPEIEMIFPGGAPFRALSELIAWAAPRYRFVTKSYDGVDAFADGDRTIVYTRGALAGEWPDGTPFDGIRFIDRFVVGPRGIERQEVWNDIAEVRPA